MRTNFSYSQSKMAAILDISDKSYKNYELEKRELPLSIAVKFCEEFEVDLAWLIYGTSESPSNKPVKVARDMLLGTLRFIDPQISRDKLDRFGKYAEYIFNQSMSKGTSAIDESAEFYSLIGNNET